MAWHRAQQSTKSEKTSKTLSKGAIRNHYMTLRLILGYAEGYAPSTAADLLTRRERPKPAPTRVRYLSVC